MANICRACNNTDFGSVTAFDQHRVGNNDYLYSEGLKFDPPVEDGRRCLTEREMEKSDKFARNSKGAWSVSPHVVGLNASEDEKDDVPGGVAA